MNCLFQDGSSYHIEISPLICIVNQWISLYMTGTPVMKELNYANFLSLSLVPSDIYLGPCKIFMMECFAKIVNAVNYFRKKAPWMFHRVLNILLSFRV